MMGYVGCYSLRLYCDGEHVLDKISDFQGRNFRECLRDAKSRGWLVKCSSRFSSEISVTTGNCLCPECAVRRAKKKEAAK